MPNWSASMQQTFEYYKVNPNTWMDETIIDTIVDATIEYDESVGTLGSASITSTEMIDECYVRIYLITIQNGVKERFVLGTFLVQAPADNFDGRNHSITLDAYTPLIEMKEKMPSIGYTLLKTRNIMDAASTICREVTRGPNVEASSTKTLDYNFVANTDDTWLTFLTDLISLADFKFDVDAMGNILFAPIQDIASLQPVFTYTDDNSSVLYPSISIDRDLYGIPNVVEVIWSSGLETMYARAVNSDPNSPISTVNRGREIVKRVTDPGLPGLPSQTQLNEYATQLLRNVSSLEYKITYTHGYLPVRVGDCIRLNYGLAGLSNIKAKVVSQSIRCTPGCPVTETASFTTNLWR